VGRHTGRRWRLGDALKVRIERATPALRQIDLLPEEETMANEQTKKPKTRGSGRSKKPGKAATPRVLSGPPEERGRNDRPPRLTAQKVYFGEWEGNAEDEATGSKKSGRRRKK